MVLSTTSHLTTLAPDRVQRDRLIAKIKRGGLRSKHNHVVQLRLSVSQTKVLPYSCGSAFRRQEFYPKR